MKAKFFIVIAFPVLLSCNNQQNRNKENARDTDKNAVLMENAKVEENNDDEKFVKEAASAGLKEVELGRYAEQNAVNPRIKNFAAIMVREHSRTNDELKSIASAQSINTPASPDESDLNRINDLKKKSGAEFDKDYMKEMADDHDKSVERFRRFAESGNDPELKAFAARTLPVLLIHQDSARNIKDAVNR